MSDLFHEEGPPASGQKVLLATTAYDTPSAAYCFAIARSREALAAAGIQSGYLLLQGNCHVDDARNSVVRNFLESDCTELVFLDADVNWEPQHLVRLCGHDCDIVGGVYPYRRNGSETMPVRLMDGAKIGEGGLLEVDGLPTGFMRIRRAVLERAARDAPKYLDKIHETALVFDRPTPGADKTRWGGDIDFCNRFRSLGGRIYADTTLRLGHTGKVVVTDSLAAHLRRITGETIGYVVPRLRAGIEDSDDFNELSKAASNIFTADPGVLALVAGVARKCRGPIIETGSGMSTVAMAAVSDDFVYSLEHIEHYAMQTMSYAGQAGLSNVRLCYAPLKDLWYDIDRFDLPAKFTLGFCDGPPTVYGTRLRFFEALAPRCEALVVDDFNADHKFAVKVQEWALANARTVRLLGRAALILKRSQQHMMEAA